MTEPVIRGLTLTNGLTVATLASLIAGMAPEDRLIAPEGGIPLSWLVAATVDDEADEPDDEPDPVAAALAVPHLPAIARHLRHLPAPPGRPRVLGARTTLGLDVSRPAADRIAGALAGLPWPPDWLPELPAEAGR